MFIPTCGKLKSQGVQCIICNYKNGCSPNNELHPEECLYRLVRLRLSLSNVIRAKRDTRIQPELFSRL